MSRRAARLLAVALLVVGSADAAQEERITAIRIHGNNVTAEAEILALTGVTLGDAFTDTLPADVTRRLMASGGFEGVEVLKRFASIADATQIALVVVVDEHPVRVLRARDPDSQPRIVRRRWPATAMFLPILEAEDGYGLTYGAVLAWPGVAGERSRLAVPLSWGGRRQAAVEVDRGFRSGWLSRVRAGAAITRRTNPAFEEDDTRRRAWIRADRQLAGALRAGAEAAVESVDFAGHRDQLASVGADVEFDTRLDPHLPRNAVYGLVGWRHIDIDGTAELDTLMVDLRSYLGLVGQSVLVTRAAMDTADRARPLYLKPLLGGWSSLRGFRAGSFVGDTRTTGSMELRVPVSSPLSIARAGFSVFVDAGKAYDRGVRFRHAPLHLGSGAGLWLSAPALQVGLSVARGRAAGTRVNLGVDLAF